MFGVLKTAMQSTICQLFNIIIVPENTFSLVKAYILHITSCLIFTWCPYFVRATFSNSSYTCTHTAEHSVEQHATHQDSDIEALDGALIETEQQETNRRGARHSDSLQGGYGNNHSKHCRRH